jgi:hypothetical protein
MRKHYTRIGKRYYKYFDLKTFYSYSRPLIWISTSYLLSAIAYSLH